MCMSKYGQQSRCHEENALVHVHATTIQSCGIGTDHGGDLANAMLDAGTATKTKGFPENSANDLEFIENRMPQ